MSKIIRAISENGGVVVTAINSTDIVNAMEKYHQTSAVVSAALGRTLTAAVLMGANLKSTEDVLTIKFSGNGPIGRVVAVVNGKGEVKGYVDNAQVELPLRNDGKLDVGTAVGKEGILFVIKDLGLKEPYIGQVPIVSGEIAEDITSYYAISEQMANVTSLGVLVNPDLTISAAGGYLLHLLPGATEEEITLIEHNLSKMESVTSLLEKGKLPLEIAYMLLDGFNPNLLDEQEMVYKCNCSMDSMEKAIISLGEKELQNL